MSLSLILTTLSLLSQDTEALKASLGRMGDHSYRFIVDGREIGTLTMKTSVRKTGDRDAAIFDDAMFLDMNGKRADIVMKQTSSLDALFIPQSVESKSTEQALNFSATLKDGSLRITQAGVEREEKVGERATTMTSVWRAICVAKQERGTKLEFDWLKGQKLRVVKGNAATCNGPDRIVIDNQEYEATKWTHSCEGAPDTSLWVSKDGYLLRSEAKPEVMQLADKR